MFERTTSFRLFGNLLVALLALFGVMLSENAPAAPAPKAKIYALLYIPKKSNQLETIRNRRSQIDSVKSRFTLYEAIRRLKSVDLPSFPKKSKGKGVENDHDEDVAWLAQNLKVEFLDGTGALRISLATGSHREQALLINAIIHTYFKGEVRRKQEHFEKNLESLHQLLRKLKEKVDGEKGEDKRLIQRRIDEVQEGIKQNEDALRTLPKLLELADVPPK